LGDLAERTTETEPAACWVTYCHICRTHQFVQSKWEMPLAEEWVPPCSVSLSDEWFREET
jgi:hypothetical protein